MTIESRVEKISGLWGSSFNSTEYVVREPGRTARFTLWQPEAGEILVDSGGWRMALEKGKGGDFRLKEFSRGGLIEWQNKIVFSDDPWLRSPVIYKTVPGGGETTVWYKGKEEGGFSFWGLSAEMPLTVKNPGFTLPTVVIRPQYTPGEIIYYSSSWGQRNFYTKGWELVAGESEYQLQHDFGAEEKLKIAAKTENGWQKFSLAREIVPGSNPHMPPSFKNDVVRNAFFASASLEVEFPAPFPGNLVKPGQLPENEDERAKALIGNFRALDKIFQQILPPPA